jgi:tetratricopeptide (TPR) repeat protein
MVFKWLNTSAAEKTGVALADEFAPPPSTPKRQSASCDPNDTLPQILKRADEQIRGLRLNFYRKAKFANSFKWRLLENGVEKPLADELTQRLVIHLSANQAATSPSDATARTTGPRRSHDAKYLHTMGNKAIAQGHFTEAVAIYQDLIRLNPRHVIALNNLAAALCKLGLYKEAEDHFYKAIRTKPDYADAHSNIGALLLLKGEYKAAEDLLRRALKLNPRLADARVNLGLTLAHLNRLREARGHIEKVLRYEPANPDALTGMALIAKMEGRFDQARDMLRRALKVKPNMPQALASQADMRKMTQSDIAWLERAEELAASGIEPLSESELRFSIGKYYDDVENFERAFQNYKRANDLLKPIATPYDREGYKKFVEAMIRAETKKVAAPMTGRGSESMKPVFVVGMPRSGTSLTEQIISSHPSARGAGEQEFWSEAIREHEAAIAAGALDESTRNKLAAAYLRVLETKTGDALRIVDKAPVNSDYLGVIHSVFPKARIIYMQRDPIDTCLSCYFQKFVLSLNFAMDLADLAHYYRQHERLITHWRAVLPAGTILDVPYEGLVADQEGWSRKILDFLDLEWNDQVLDFHKTKRPVATASFWQVRQKIYKSSVQRWRNYEKFVGPLRDLQNSGR